MATGKRLISTHGGETQDFQYGKISSVRMSFTDSTEVEETWHSIMQQAELLAAFT
ncbi:hypothetical protein [Cohnella sp. CFH 77786]|uniref:hypothetical protein n=1 Tax=Cohnella sp. CFH 77786 TaxID=2662265 RepID=UPI001C60B7DA|nr:hypothetical protein [Cohnella sp. CFH 77786]